ncbi:apolipoprotein(a)-like isoform X2 [Mercenaria mercenaria]|nr:apolipoprotein(a)-like isoform X2 [Mercenaria mercenaria]
MFSDINIIEASNYCRDPNGTRGAPWCYTEDNSTEWEFCDIPDCSAATVSQGKCQGDYCGDPDSPISTDNICSQTKLEEGYTRNIGSVMNYTCQTLLDVFSSLVSYCPVRTCQANFYWTSASLSCGENECYEAGKSENYTGKRTCSASGYTCLAWNTQSPHAHNFTSSDFPDSDINAAGAYCRDPGGSEGRPWCFTTETPPALEYCDIPECSTLTVNHGNCLPPPDCGVSSHNVTTDEPCTEIDFNATVTPDVTTEGAIKTFYCENLLTRTKAKIDYCPVEICQSNATWRSASLSCASSECYNGTSEDYIGRRICTSNGTLCQRWDTQSPWSHPYIYNSMFPDKNITYASNYCRDPNGTRGAPWCYTEDPSTEWEFCDIPDCSVVTIAQGICPGNYCGDPDSPVSTDNICSKTKQEGGYTRTVDSIIKYTCLSMLDGFSSLASYCPVRTCQSNFYWNSVSLSCGVNECYEAGSSRNYTGKRNCSASGYACLAWNTQSPHAHNFTSSDFPDTDINEAGAYCRDPDGSQGQPWCFTTETDPVMEYCDIPECSTLPVNHGKCTPPANCGVSPHNVTVDEPCTELDLDAIVTPNVTTEGAVKIYSCKNLLTRTKAKIDYCPLELCQSNGTWRSASLSCGSSECFNGTSEDYIGSRICTASGKICQRWDQQSPWSHPYIYKSMFPDKNATEASNYCRDPNGARGAPWCYTSDPSTEWEFCDIPDCSAVTVSQGLCPGDYCGDPDSPLSTDNTCSNTKLEGGYTRNIGSLMKYECQTLLVGFYSLASYCPVRTCQDNFHWTSASISCGVNECYGAGQSRNYTGRRNCTASGYTCQAWNTQSPHEHNFTSSDFPDNDINEAGSYCRDPDGSQGQPWCFTTETDPAMEYCDIPQCSTLPVNFGICLPPPYRTHGLVYKRLNVDRPGFDMQTSIPFTRTPTSCCLLCNEYPFCVMVTFNNTDGLCMLYQENAAVLASIECSIRKCYLIEYLI